MEIQGDNDVVYGWQDNVLHYGMPVKMATVRYLLRAGQIVHENIRERLAVQVLHEAAYRDTLQSSFALRLL